MKAERETGRGEEKGRWGGGGKEVTKQIFLIYNYLSVPLKHKLENPNRLHQKFAVQEPSGQW